MIIEILLTIILLGVIFNTYLQANKYKNNKQSYTKKDAELNKLFINEAINSSATSISKNINDRLNDITEKTALIKKSHDDSSEVISNLQNEVNNFNDLLFNKKKRGGYGEAQLNIILEAIYGDNTNYYQEQYEYNNVIVDAAIFLPNEIFIPVDSKFPYENFSKVEDSTLEDHEIKHYLKLFKDDIKARIKETAKYIQKGITTNYAVMFIPSEAVFAYIYSNIYEVVELARQQNVLIVSPTTMNAVISNIRHTTQIIEQTQNAQEIREQIKALSLEFSRLDERWNKFDKKIGEIITKKEDVSITVKKISSKFNKITKKDK